MNSSNLCTSHAFSSPICRDCRTFAGISYCSSNNTHSVPLSPTPPITLPSVLSNLQAVCPLNLKRQSYVLNQTSLLRLPVVHLRNSPSFELETLDVLILDEADRMLSDGLADELKECVTARQMMLFSATMTDDVDALVHMSLHRPARLFIDPKQSTARDLVQEFVRVRAEREKERPALLAALCRRTCKQGVIIFFSSKIGRAHV